MIDLPAEELRSLITEFNERADKLGCVVIEGEIECDRTVVIFAGNLERFHMLSAAQTLKCKVVYVQDPESGWYQGSCLIPELSVFCQMFLKDEIGNKPALFFGQSSGAYAALVASTYFPGSTVVACAPQTRSDSAVKTKVHFAGIRPLATPDDLIDVRARLIEASDPHASTTIVMAVGEADNPVHAHFWMDYFHGLHVWDLPNVGVSIVNSNSHAVVHRNVRAYADLLSELAAELSAPVARRNAITREFLDRTYSKP
ncbi:hypothetical protein [Lichenifustis flavocetrariae]|uniref:Uncharacterized protein n=1 Tax=Lichenifustis flavocetrariae TaxID=2949735 RepID=A0AA41Z2U5_9HYPH|nr:hypothetical protein [Lichenifustis flavocetrariae]MCW6511951.1 hypothetical protein [Lichenifustis flavocetrariae]